jgi:CubicO group peptidase (beta-lactamase class C family)
MKRLLILLIALVITCDISLAQPDFKKLDAYYAKALKDWDIPGMSIAVVKDGKIVFSKSYGVKEVGKAEAPDENTLYAIASNTKAFTSAAMAQLVEEGKLKWNDNVQKYLPYFELYDHWVSAETTITDLLCHRVGLGTFSGDLIWYRSDLSTVDIIKRVKYLPKAYDFRSGYGYSNVMYVTAGEVMSSVTGQTWSEIIHSRFFKPLGMTRSITTIADLQSKGNYASPHILADSKHIPMDWEEWKTIGAMGGIISSVKDMSQWMIFNLNNGVWEGKTLLSKDSRNILWTPHANFRVDHTDNDHSVHLRGYGLGWNIGDYRGKLKVSHTGGYSGMLSTVAMIPDEKLGVVILTNGMRSIFTPLANYTIDAFLKAPEKDWSAEALANELRNKDTRIEERRKARILNTKPSLSSEKYAGTYESKSYGKITVIREGETLKISFEHTPDLSATLSHWHYDTWELKWNNPGVLPWFTFGTVKFDLDNNNKVTGLSFDVPNDDFLFEELNAEKVD